MLDETTQNKADRNECTLCFYSLRLNVIIDARFSSTTLSSAVWALSKDKLQEQTTGVFRFI